MSKARGVLQRRVLLGTCDRAGGGGAARHGVADPMPRHVLASLGRLAVISWSDWFPTRRKITSIPPPPPHHHFSFALLPHSAPISCQGNRAGAPNISMTIDLDTPHPTPPTHPKEEEKAEDPSFPFPYCATNWAKRSVGKVGQALPCPHSIQRTADGVIKT